MPIPSVSPSPSVSPKPSVTPTPSVKPKITLDKKSLVLYTTKSTSAQLKATVTGPSKTVTFVSSNTKVAKVDKTGKVTLVGVGTATITAKVNNVSATCKVEVKKVALTLNAKSKTLYTTKLTKFQLQAKVTGPSSKVTFQSSNTKVAKVDKSGMVTAVAAGSATIKATANGVTATCKVVVKKPTITLKTSKITVKVGKTASITAKATPTNKIEYSSSNKKIATVDSKGKIKGVRAGTAKITVKSNGVKKTIQVTVKR